MIEDKDWEKVGYGTSRLKVPGGWFLMLFTGGPQKTAFFYPDPDHIWDGSVFKEGGSAAEVKSARQTVEELVKAKLEKAAEEAMPAPSDSDPETPSDETKTTEP